MTPRFKGKPNFDFSLPCPLCGYKIQPSELMRPESHIIACTKSSGASTARSAGNPSAPLEHARSLAPMLGREEETVSIRSSPSCYYAPNLCTRVTSPHLIHANVSSDCATEAARRCDLSDLEDGAGSCGAVEVVAPLSTAADFGRGGAIRLSNSKLTSSKLKSAFDRPFDLNPNLSRPINFCSPNQ
jgi:hypothetical protein